MSAVSIVEVSSDDVLSVTFDDGSRRRFGYEDAQRIARAADVMREIREAREAADEDQAHDLNQWMRWVTR